MTAARSRTTPTSAFGDYLRAQRQMARLTLREVAAMTNISNPYLSQVERGLHQPSVKVIRSLAEALNLSAETLLAHAAGLDHDATSTRVNGTPSLEAAIDTDPRLTNDQKAAMRLVLRGFLEPS